MSSAGPPPKSAGCSSAGLPHALSPRVFTGVHDSEQTGLITRVRPVGPRRHASALRTALAPRRTRCLRMMHPLRLTLAAARAVRRVPERTSQRCCVRWQRGHRTRCGRSGGSAQTRTRLSWTKADLARDSTTPRSTEPVQWRVAWLRVSQDVEPRLAAAFISPAPQGRLVAHTPCAQACKLSSRSRLPTHSPLQLCEVVGALACRPPTTSTRHE